MFFLALTVLDQTFMPPGTSQHSIADKHQEMLPTEAGRVVSYQPFLAPVPEAALVVSCQHMPPQEMLAVMNSQQSQH